MSVNPFVARWRPGEQEQAEEDDNGNRLDHEHQDRPKGVAEPRLSSWGTNVQSMRILEARSGRAVDGRIGLITSSLHGLQGRRDQSGYPISQGRSAV